VPETASGLIIDGRYELEHLIGKGGGGKVFRARQRSTGQAVAIKILEFGQAFGEHARRRRKDRFRREMRVCARLDHPDIVRLIDFGEHDDSLYSVFEFVRGQTLRHLLRTEGALTLTRARVLLGQLLEALVHAHGHGVIHRDLKPSNLMICDDGERARIKVLDFGVSAIPNGFSNTMLTRLTLSNEMVGTPAYAAPEQLRGDAPTAKTDLYSWGLVLLECLTGTSAMTGASLGEIFQKQLSPTPVPIPARLREHPLGTVLRWVLEKDVSRRAGSARDVLTRLDAITADELATLGDDAGYFVQRAPLEERSAAGELLTRTAPAAAVEGERRQITALCCRLQLRCEGAPVEPALLDVYRSDLFALALSTVEEFGGVLVGGFGELALYYFGIPRAKDGDGRRAARAALELSARVRSRSAALDAQSQVRVWLEAGLHTGLLTAGERSSSRALSHGSVAAVAVALAQRQGNDGPAITVSEGFRRVNARHAEFEAGDKALELPWRADPIVTHRLTGESLSDVFERGVGPMIGRERELDALVEAWCRAGERGRVALVVGEAGMGKSRLLHELQRRTRDEGHGVLNLRFLPEMRHVALGPLLELLAAELGVEQRPSCAELAAVLGEFEVELDSAVPLLCGWMSVPLEPPYDPLPYSPQKQRGMLYTLLVELVRALLERRRGYLQVEDLHWADPSTLDWLGRWFAANEERGFTLMSARPEFKPRWEDVELLTLTLEPLAAEQVAAMIAGLPACEGIAAALVEKIVARADGVPLFVEELARAFVERLGSVETGAELPEVPLTLRSLMMSRLDALGSAKETAQFAAAIGRDFDLELLLASVASKDEATLLADLDQLASVGLVLGRRRIGHQTHLFRHALLRDAAYESMTVAGRAAVHDAIAEALLHEFPERVEARPDLAARHLEGAGRDFEAQRYWLDAGRNGMEELAYDEARVYLQRGLDALARCPPSGERDIAELDLLNMLSASFIARFGYGTSELVDIFKRVEELLDGVTKPHERALPSYWGQYLFNAVRPNFTKAYPIAKDLLDKATRLEAPSFVLQAHSALARAEFWMGDFVAACRSGDACEATHDRERDKQLIAISGEDPYLAGISFAAVAQLVRGNVEQAIIDHERVLSLAREYNYPSVIASMWTQMAWIHIYRGMYASHSEDLARACEYARESSEYAANMGFPFWDIQGQLMLSAAQIFRGNAEGLEGLESAMNMYLMIGADIGFSWFHGCIAHILLQLGRLDEAAESLAKANAHVERSAERFFVPELERLGARLLDARGRPRAAAAKLAAAMQLARESEARLWEVHAAADLLDHDPDLRDPYQDALAETAAWWRAQPIGRDLASVQRVLG
jgi:TOMM system kinase/cyclase fusion protein